MKVVAVVGNPKPASRTRDAAVRLIHELGYSDPEVIEVAELGPGLLGWGDENVATAKRATQDADLVVFASPTFKATYTGLLKTFIDQFETKAGLEGVVAVPLMLGAGLAHAQAPEMLLKPVLVEIGATCPTSGLYQLDSSYRDDPGATAWVQRWKKTIDALVTL
ncbi:NADPH-dependent FMN reductase [Microbacterium tumbae]